MTEIDIMGTIGWDVTAQDVSRQLRDAAPGPLALRINSPGGSVFDGLAIANMISRRGDVTAIVDGLAASAASIIAIGAERRVMAPGTLLMIHNPWSMAGGNADDLRKEADVLDVIAGEMAKLYADASGGKLSKAEALAIMEEETWLTGEQAVALGLVHAIEGKAKPMASIDPKRHNYRNIPKGLIMDEPTTTPAPKAGILEGIMAKLSGENVAGLRSELETARAELVDASAALVDAAAQIATAKAETETVRAALVAKDAEIQAIEAKHIDALAAARIEGAQEATAQMLKANASEPLPHVEPEGETGTATEKWNALRAEGKYAEAGAHYAKHKTAILKGE
jgi:ATP-dependent Clp protease protease subunit